MQTLLKQAPTCLTVQFASSAVYSPANKFIMKQNAHCKHFKVLSVPKVTRQHINIQQFMKYRGSLYNFV